MNIYTAYTVKKIVLALTDSLQGDAAQV